MCARFALSARRVLLALVLVLSLSGVALLPFGPTADPRVARAADDDVVISQVFGGGSSGPNVPPRDFVELVNLGGEPIALGGWTVQYAAASGDTWTAIPLQGVVPAGAHYLVRLGETNQPTAPMLAPNASGKQDVSASNGKVALVRDGHRLDCLGAACVDDLRVIDFVGYGTANAFETTPAPAGSNTQAIRRADGAADSDANGVDFTLAAPDPRNNDAAGEACVRAAPLIRAIQGAGHRSLLEGCRVTDVVGTVTAVRPDGFFLQDANPDGDDATAEGLFVTVDPLQDLARVVAGDQATVEGTVVEARPADDMLTVTQITASAITVDPAAGTPPTPVVIGRGGRLPPAVVWDADRGENVEAAPFDPALTALDFFESLEGMVVQIDDPVVVGPTSEFGELVVLASDGVGIGPRTARGGLLLGPDDPNPERIVLDDDLLLAPQWPLMPIAKLGDHFAPDCCVGVMDYANPTGYRVQLTAIPTLIPGTLSPETTNPAGEGELAVATFNVENLDPGDGAARFAELAQVIVHDLGAPDLLAVEEIQDRNGPLQDATVDAMPTFALLAQAIADAGGPCYAFAQIDPRDDQDGGEPGGNIRQGFLYRTDRGLTLVDRPAGDATTPVTIDPGPQLSHNPGRIDPRNPAFQDTPGVPSASRKPLVGEFSFNGQRLFVIANHFNSKGPDEHLFGRRQPPRLLSEPQRVAQAQVVRDFVDELFAADADANVIVLGDLNDFPGSPPLDMLTAGDAAEDRLTNLIETLPANEQYSYLFGGNGQTLDHVLLSANLAAQVASFDVVHVNVEFGDGASDHDPQVVHLALAADGTPSPSDATPVAGTCP